jgi:hypothetical protein
LAGTCWALKTTNVTSKDFRMNPNNPFSSSEFRKELGEMFDEKLGPISELVANHERTLQRSWGAMWAFGLLWTFVIGCITALGEYLFHRK